MVGHLPKYEARIPLAVHYITISGNWVTADVPARVYAPAERSATPTRAAVPARRRLRDRWTAPGGLQRPNTRRPGAASQSWRWTTG
jgi:hypothetical protein